MISIEFALTASMTLKLERKDFASMIAGAQFTTKTSDGFDSTG